MPIGGVSLDDLGSIHTNETSTTHTQTTTTTKLGTETKITVDEDWDALNEHVCKTIWRDVKSIAEKTLFVLIPWRCTCGNEERGMRQKNRLKDWDLWGPLLLCLLLASSLVVAAGSATDGGQSSLIFTIVFIIVWVGSFVVTANAKLLGSDRLGFLQGVSLIGYSIAPICVASFINCFDAIPRVVKYIIGAVAFVWSMQAAIGFLLPVIPPGKRILALYPVLLFYLALSWLVMAS